MPVITEGELRFAFPKGWTASKFDEWSFYRNQFARLSNAEVVCNRCDVAVECPKCQSKRVAGTKGIDVLAFAPDKAMWQVEVKDYRVTRVTDFRFLADVVALKVRDTLACLAAAQISANDAGEQAHAKSALSCVRIRVVLHLEMPPTHSPHKSAATQRMEVLAKLKSLLKAIDPRPQVVSLDSPGTVGWTVTEV